MFADESDIWRAAADKLTTARAKWRPLPHQVAPEGNWYGWLLRAGRGAGKTDACANYIVEHVNGPPCMPGPVPHWIGIIAPTQGDAATACFYGPSGIRAHDPTAHLSAGIGGASIKWPNGSEAKLFGAHERDDIERLRAGGNRSLVAGTLVATERGEVPIECVSTGERVWTRYGLRTVLLTQHHGVKPIWRLTTTHGTLHATADHEIALPDGSYRRLDELRVGGNILAWPYHTSSMMTSVGSNDQLGTTQAHVEDCYIGTSGRNITDQFPRECTSTTCTTMIGTPQTSRDLNLLIPARTPESIRDVTCMNQTNELVGSVHWYDKERFHESHVRSTSHSVNTVATQLRAATKILDTATRTGTGATGVKIERVPSVGQRSRWFIPVELVNAVSGAEPSSSGDHAVIGLHTRNGCVPCAMLGSQPTYEATRAPALASVLDVSFVGTTAEVYDLTVEHDHEFFANGILVANCLVWAEELAAWRHLEDCWDHMTFGLRIGPRPHWVASTTPKPRPLIKKLIRGEVANVVVTRGSMYDNPYIQSDIKQKLEEKYGNTKLGAQELYGELLDQSDGALWVRDQIEALRVNETPGDLTRISVGVDPSGGAGEQGIVVVGKQDLIVPDVTHGSNGRKRVSHGYVLGDRTCRLSPNGWGRRAIQAAIDFDADDVVVETNFGGDMALAVLQGAADALGVSIPIRKVTASRGKRARAEPVAALTEREKWHHVGRHEELEDQLCTWTDDAGYSPDRLDAMVWPAWQMKLVGITMLSGRGSFGGRALAQTRFT